MSSSKRPAETAPDSAPVTKKRGRPAKNNIEESATNVALQRPGLIPNEYNPYLSVGQGQGVGSPTKSELLAQVNNQGKQIADQEGKINDLLKRVAALEAGQGKRYDNAASRYQAGRKSLESSLAGLEFEPRLPRLSLSRGRGQSEDRQSLLKQRSDSPGGSYHGMGDDAGSYHGMDNNEDEPISPNCSLRDKSNGCHQDSVPKSRETLPIHERTDDFRQSQSFKDGVKDGSIIDTGIPRSQVQRQQLSIVPPANTPITGVGSLKARSSDIARRTDPLYRMAYADKVKDL